MKIATSSKIVTLFSDRRFLPMYLSLAYDQEEPLNVPLYDSESFQFDHNLFYTPDYLGSDFGSNLGQVLDALILMPPRVGQDMAGLNVVNYADVCADGYPGFVNVRVSPDTSPSKIRVRFTVEGGIPEQPYSDYTIDTFAPCGMDAIPDDVFEDFKSVLLTRGVEITDEHTIDCRLRQNLPDIIYTIASDSDTPVVNVVLTPEDYVGDDESGFCLLGIRPSMSTELALGPNFMKQVAVIFDYANEQVGFCELV